MVPKKIHYCWFGGNTLPENAKKCIESWKKYMPTYEVIRHDESNFDIKSNRYVREAYERKKYAFVSDYARLKIIYNEGGIYFDTDVELLKPLNKEMLENGFFAKEDKKYINTGLGFAAKMGDKTVGKMLKDYKNIPFILEDGTEDKTSCPIRNTKCIEDDIKMQDNKESVDGKPIYPKEFFAPLEWRTGEIKKTKNTYAIHYGAASWVSENIRLRLKKRHEHVKKYGKNIGIAIFKFKRLFGIIK